MTPQQYLKNRLETCSHYTLSEQEKKQLKEKGAKDYLLSQITRKKFRKWKAPDEALERINKVLDYCLGNNAPIVFRFRFGGYKLWRLESSPEVDWAEFFTFAYYSEYLAPIIAIHKPGAKLMFTSDDVFVERLDNIPKEDTERYYSSFQKLAAEFMRFAPKNFSIEMVRHSSLFKTPEDLEKEFDAKLKEIAPTWRETYTPEKLKSSLATSELNIKWNGIQDLTNLSEKEKHERIERSAIMHDALVQMPTIRSFVDTNPALIYIFTTPLSNRVLALGTTKSSAAKFWVGTGVLEDRDGGYIDHILSPSQIEKIREISCDIVSIDLLPLKNFSNIKVYIQRLNFTS